MVTPNLVSILTPTYHHERYIGACIESALSQTYENWEQLILDDGSEDHTGIIAREYAQKDRRIKYFYQAHRGREFIGDNYNWLLEQSQGEYIAILEGDDYWAENKLNQLLPRIQDNPETIMSYGYTQVVDDRDMLLSKKNRLIPGDDIVGMGEGIVNNQPITSITRVLLHGMVMMPVSTIIRRTALEKIGGFRSVEDGHAVDYATILELSRIGPFLFVPSIVGYWRRHENQQSASDVLEKAMLADYHYAISFMDRYASELQIGQAGRMSIEKSWRRARAGAYLRSGRNSLIHREWRTAREKFIQVFRHHPDKLQHRYALAGLIFSLFHADPRRISKYFGEKNR